MTDLAVAWEWPDGSGGQATAADRDEAEDIARGFGGQPVRVWIGREVVQRGYIAADEVCDE